MYEARDRVGGRVHQVELGGRLVDLGPNWVHGNVKSNPISQLAAKTKTVLHEWETRQAVIDSTGQQMDDAEALRSAGIEFLHIPTPDREGFTYDQMHQGEGCGNGHTEVLADGPDLPLKRLIPLSMTSNGS